MRSFQILEHTADVRLKVQGDTLEELFNAALEGLFAVLKPRGLKLKKISRNIVIQSVDTNLLLIDFLSEILTLAHIYKDVFTAIQFKNLSEKKLEGALIGYETMSFAEDIKAVTYHEVNIKRNKKDLWETIIIFDI